MNRGLTYGIMALLAILVAGLGGWLLFGPPAQVRSQLEQKQDRIQQLQQKVNQLQSRLDEKTSQLRETKRENEQIAREFEEKLEEAKVSRSRQSVVLELQEQVLFALGSAVITDSGKQRLRKVASILNQHPDREIRVEGHTDDLPIQSERYESNWELSTQRGVNVLKYLVYAQGVSRERIGATGFGQFRPKVPNTSPENRARNRRVEITLLPPERTTRPLSDTRNDT